MFTTPQPITLDNISVEMLEAFDCNCPIVNKYFKSQLIKDIKSHNSIGFVSFSSDNPELVAGFYILKNKSLKNKEFQNRDFRDKNTQGFVNVSCIELAYLGVNNIFKGKKLGSTLLFHAEDIYLKCNPHGMVLHLLASPSAVHFYVKYQYNQMKITDEHRINGIVPFFKPWQQIAKEIEVANVIGKNVIDVASLESSSFQTEEVSAVSQ